MRHRTLICAGALVAATSLLAAAGPAHASGLQRFDNTWTEQDFSHGDEIGAGCPSFVGTLEEDLSGRDVGFLTADGIAHVHTTVQGVVTLTPDDPADPSFHGSYAMVQTGTYTDGGSGTKVMTRAVNGTLAGSDGSSYQLHETLHLTTDGRGRSTVSLDHLSCS